MQNLWLGLKAVFWFVLAFVFLLCLPIVLILPPVVVVALLVSALLLALPPFWLWRARGRRHIWGEYPSYLRCALASVMVVGLLVGLPVYYLSFQVEARPVLMPTVTLSDGDRTIVFQGMQHVGSETFYKSVVYDLENALAQGYRLYYEGVQPATPESDQWFSDNLAGGGDLSSNYRTLAEACGMKFQIDYFAPLLPDFKEHPERHFTADVTTLQMQQEYERLTATDPVFAAAVRESGQNSRDEARRMNDAMTRLIQWQQSYTDSQRFLSGVVCRGVLNMALAQPSTGGILDPVILDFRNRHLVDTLLADPSKRIYITYGAHHLQGILALLKEKAPALQLKSVKWQRAMSAPENFKKAL